MNSELEQLNKSKLEHTDDFFKAFDIDKSCISRLRKYGSDSECQLFKRTEDGVLSHESSTILKVNDSEYIRYLELQNSLLKSKIIKIVKISGISEDFLIAADKEITEESIYEEMKSLDLESIKNFEKRLCLIFSSIDSKINTFSEKIHKNLTNIQTLKQNFRKILQDFKNKEKILTEKNLELEKNYSPKEVGDKISEAYKLIKYLKSELKNAKSETITPTVTVYIQDLECNENLESFKAQQEEIMQKNYEDLILLNMQLKSDLLSNEGDLTKLRHFEEEVRILKEKCDFLEKVNKELTSKKNDSDDSLDLDCNNIKEMIEIQELRAALRSISEKYEQEKETILRDCEESRQDIETQMFRLRNEKAYIEVKFKDNEKQLSDINREKERLEGTVSLLKKEIERLKDCKIPEGPPRPSLSRYGSSELLQYSNSGDFELTESVDKFDAINSNDLYEMLLEEVNDMALKIKDNLMTNTENRSSKDVIYKFIDTGLKIKSLIIHEVVPGAIIKDISETLAEILNKYKMKISMLEQEKAEKDKRIEELVRIERYEIQTEPSPRMSTPAISLESSYFMKRQLQMEKSRVYDKKHEIHLHKEQIAYLKKNVRDLQAEIDRLSKMDFGHLKEFWWNLGKEIPILNGDAEDMVEVFSKMLGYNAKEMQGMNAERKNKKSKMKFSLFR
ncbi:hypothetical protein SteCoe_25439 [Stentor coeruleus]|uniref:Uncharacterized protein n=1 Tax=Stentor coeruleus TaxID=5963 RepID=A0A1R2BF73_9CILI|nr:hypothetical protein SteCoe_25439 [Stentor coeruleus]